MPHRPPMPPARRSAIRSMAVHGLLAAMLAFTAAAFSEVAAAAPAPPALLDPLPDMVSHRAVYELTLDEGTISDTVSDAEGRMVYDFAGSTCEGYTTRLRYVARISDSDGNARLTDVATTTFEDIAGKTFNFATKSLVDGTVSEDTSGSAERAGPSVAVTIAKPQTQHFTLASTFRFPSQHLAAIIAAAERGEHFVQIDLFDGSEEGRKAYQTAVVIGADNSGADDLGDEATAAGAGLSGLRSWPVTISYFTGKAVNGEEKPSYELSFILYENGITRRMRLDYGDFALKGKLVRLDVRPSRLPAKGCR